MTQSTVDSPPVEGQKPAALGDLGWEVHKKIEELQREYLAKFSRARAQLARLRRGLGKPAGSVPEIWELTIGLVPPSLVSRGDAPSRAEQAAHAAMTLYALHQQSQTVPIHKPGERFGTAVRRLRAEKSREEAVTRRFMAVATAQSIDELLFHVRGLITQLRREKHGLDYAMFADDIHKLLTPGREIGVRLAWGRDFYRTTSGKDAGNDTTESSDSTATSDSDDDK